MFAYKYTRIKMVKHTINDLVRDQIGLVEEAGVSLLILVVLKRFCNIKN